MMHKDFTRNRLSEHFVYESYDEENQLFFNRGSIGFVLEGWPIVGATLQAQGEISEFLKEEENLPMGASLQIMMLGTSDIKNYLEHWAAFRKDDVFKTLASKRSEFLTNKAKVDGVIKDVTLLIVATMPSKKFSKDLVLDMQRCRDTLRATLNSIGLVTKNVSSEKLIASLRIFFNWDKESHPELNPYELLSEQILRGDFNLQVLSQALKINDESIIALEAFKRPSKWQLSMMDLFLGNELRRGEQIKSDFILSFSLQMLPRQALEKSNAIAKRESLMKSMKSGLMKWLPNLDEEYEDMDNAVVSIQAGDRVVVINQNIVLKDDSQKIKERVFEYRSMMRRCGFHFIPCDNDHLPVLLACLPMQLVEEC